MHICLPQICVFRNKYHQNPEHSIIFQNTSANVSPHNWNKSGYQILQENHRAIHCAPPLLILRSWERSLPITLISPPPVQSYHNSTANFQVHTRVTFFVNGDERPLFMVYFLKRLETSPFRWRPFCRCPINRPCHAFPRAQNIFTNGTLIPKIYTACSFVDEMFSSVKLFWLRVFRAHTEHFWEQISIFLSFAHVQRVQKWLWQVPAQKLQGHVCLLLPFHEWQNPELLRGYLYFLNALLILMIFRNKYGRAVTVGMYGVCPLCWYLAWLLGTAKFGTKRFSNSENTVQTNIHEHFEILLWTQPWTQQSNFFIRCSGCW